MLAPFGGRDPPPRPAVEDVSEVFAPFDAGCLARLARLVDASGGARVVLSSSWRASPAAVAAVRDRFRAFGAPLAREALDLTTDPRRHEPRQWEIARWLDRRRAAAANWVALDDEDLVDGPENRERRDLFAERAVLVASDRGFSEGDLARAMEILGRADAAAAAAPG